MSFSCCQLHCFQLFNEVSRPLLILLLHTLTLVNSHSSENIFESKCQGAGLLGSHPFCLLAIYPFLLLSLSVHPKRSTFSSLRQRTYIGLRSVVHHLPTSIGILLDLPYLRYTQLLRISLGLLSLSISSCTLVLSLSVSVPYQGMVW